jgi:ribosomal protein S18 acetylase RimI-like enzyme
VSARADARLRYRSRPRAADVAALRRLVALTGVFDRIELAIAAELIDARLRLGEKSGYSFFFAERAGALVGYCTWGPVPLTRSSYDLYWIVVAPTAQGQGIGQALLKRVEGAVAGRGGGRLYIETSSRPVYARTRRFYRAAGYRVVARLRDFYARGDDKFMFCKVIPRRRSRTTRLREGGIPP